MTTKVLLLALTLALPATGLAGDISPGAIQVTGGSNMGLTASTRDSNGAKTDVTSYGLSVSAAAYVNHVLGLGLEMEIGHTRVEPAGSTPYQYDSFMFGPKLALDFPVAPGIAIFGDLTIGLAREEDDIGVMDGYAVATGAGVKFFLARAVSLDVGVNYRRYLVKGGGDRYEDTQLSMGAAISVYFNNRGQAHY